MQIEDIQGDPKRRSGWLIPVAVFFATACLSALVFAYYLVPDSGGFGVELPAPTDSTAPIALAIGQTRFQVPANYLPLASTREGGDTGRIAIAALLPDFVGHTSANAEAFVEMGPAARSVSIDLRGAPVPAPEAARMDRVYLVQTVDRAGTPGPYGLRQYAFRADSGYHNQDLLVGATDSGTVILLCTKPAPEVAAPSCMRDTALAPDLALSYRFRRAQLANWRTIEAGARALVTRFTVKS